MLPNSPANPLPTALKFRCRPAPQIGSKSLIPRRFPTSEGGFPIAETDFSLPSGNSGRLLGFGEPPLRGWPDRKVVRGCPTIARELAIAGGAGVSPRHDDAVEPDTAQLQKPGRRRHLIPRGPAPPDQQ